MPRSIAWAFLLCLLPACLSPTHAVTVRSWSASTEADFARGTLDGTAVDEHGRVRLAPAMETLWGPGEGIVWAVQPAGDGSAFVSLSGPARVLRIMPGAEAEVIYRTYEDSLVTAMVPDGEGGVIIGVSPEGRVVHVRSIETENTLAQTDAAFVWSLARQEDGTLWVGTGVPGRLLRLRPGGELEQVFDSGDDPVRCIALHADGTLVFGTGGRGRVVRMAKDDRPFVLLDAEEAEIVSLEVAADGSIYALAADGRKRPSTPEVQRPEGMPQAGHMVEITVKPPAENGEEPARKEPQPTQPAAPKPPSFKSTAGGMLYRIHPDGSSRGIWETEREIPFAVSFSAEGELLVATGDQGRIWMLDGEGLSTKLLRIPSRQASALARAGGGGMLVGGTTDARVELLGPGPRAEGSYLSEAVDAGSVADWGRLRWVAELPKGSRLEVYGRSGNTSEPDDTWSDWVEVGEGSQAGGVATALPPARWFQARADLLSRNDLSPLLSRMEVIFQPRNRPPQVMALRVEPPGVVWVHAAPQSSSRTGPIVADDPVTRRVAESFKRISRAGKVTRKAFEIGARTFSWKARDPDGDRLLYSLEIRREGGETWFPLALRTEEEFYSWDARAMQDGHYRVRLSAEDSPDNPNGAHRVDRKISDSFLIDNSRPSVGGLEVERPDGGYVVRFTAKDPGGLVAAVEVALDGEGWIPLYPVDGVADSELERYEFRFEEKGDEAQGGRKLAVRVTDAAGNPGGDMWFIRGR
jgi:sugar lactone lactonase YvrE